MASLAYYRVSTRDQSIESQRDAMRATAGKPFDREFTDHGTSGATRAAEREGFGELLRYARDGDTVYVYAVDRLGRDAIDVQQTVRDLIARGVAVHVHGLGLIAKGVGELILAVLAQVAAMERTRIAERTAAGRATAWASLEATGRTHRGKASMGRPFQQDPAAVIAWRKANGASLRATADHFGVGLSTVKRYAASGTAGR
jgi:putative DNA-invertase from lambdoid prophage Rac